MTKMMRKLLVVMALLFVTAMVSAEVLMTRVEKDPVSVEGCNDVWVYEYKYGNQTNDMESYAFFRQDYVYHIYIERAGEEVIAVFTVRAISKNYFKKIADGLAQSVSRPCENDPEIYKKKGNKILLYGVIFVLDKEDVKLTL